MYAILGWDRKNVPPEYTNLRAARYLGVDPREFLDWPIYWRNLALAAEAAEGEAEAEAFKLRR